MRALTEWKGLGSEPEKSQRVPTSHTYPSSMTVTDRTNQHFVPQFYFRLFSSDGRTIGTLLTRDGRTIPRAPIKGQCARRNFYGSKELESLFSQMEGRHCIGIRRVLDIANSESSPSLTREEVYRLLQAVMFQRGRTAIEIEKASSSIGKLQLQLFKDYLKHNDQVEHADEIIKLIDTDQITLSEDPCVTIVRSVEVALGSTLGITDLKLCLVRNRTDYPFIFSDAPVVFYNEYCRNVRNRGVLGIQCPGLQIFFPLDSWTLALLYDGDKYSGPFRDSLQYDVFNRGDVSQLNAIQLHHSLNAIYFGSPQHEAYAHELWEAHRPTLRTLRDEFVVGADFWVDGKPPEGTLIHSFEPQIDFNLSLSFVDCEPISQAEYVYAPRSPELRNEMRRLDELRNR